MIRKLTFRTWLYTGGLMLFCLCLGVPMLWKYGPSALEALSGGYPRLARTESMSNIYGISALGAVFILFALIMFVRQMKRSVKKAVNRYLADHPEVTMAELEDDFAAAEQVGNIWIGKHYTYSHMLDDILVENSRIVWVYDEASAGRKGTSYYFCLAFVDGKTERINISYGKISALKAAYEKFSHILVGNSPEYAYLFKNDRKAFLDMKYNQK